MTEARRSASVSRVKATAVRATVGLHEWVPAQSSLWDATMIGSIAVAGTCFVIANHGGSLRV